MTDADKITRFDRLREQIEQLHRELNLNKVGHYASKGLYFIIQWGFYMAAIAALVFALWLPLDPMSYTTGVDADSSVTMAYHNDAISALMWGVKLAMIISALFLFMSGLVARKLRKKNDRMMSAKRKVEEMVKTANEG